MSLFTLVNSIVEIVVKAKKRYHLDILQNSNWLDVYNMQNYACT